MFVILVGGKCGHECRGWDQEIVFQKHLLKGTSADWQICAGQNYPMTSNRESHTEKWLFLNFLESNWEVWGGINVSSTVARHSRRRPSGLICLALPCPANLPQANCSQMRILFCHLKPSFNPLLLTLKSELWGEKRGRNRIHFAKTMPRDRIKCKCWKVNCPKSVLALNPL